MSLLQKLQKLVAYHNLVSSSLAQSPSAGADAREKTLVNVQQLKAMIQLAAEVNARLQMVAASHITCDQVNSFVPDNMEQRRLFCGTLLKDGKRKCQVVDKMCRDVGAKEVVVETAAEVIAVAAATPPTPAAAEPSAPPAAQVLPAPEPVETMKLYDGMTVVEISKADVESLANKDIPCDTFNDALFKTPLMRERYCLGPKDKDGSDKCGFDKDQNKCMTQKEFEQLLEARRKAIDAAKTLEEEEEAVNEAKEALTDVHGMPQDVLTYALLQEVRNAKDDDPELKARLNKMIDEYEAQLPEKKPSLLRKSKNLIRKVFSLNTYNSRAFKLAATAAVIGATYFALADAPPGTAVAAPAFSNINQINIPQSISNIYGQMLELPAPSGETGPAFTPAQWPYPQPTAERQEARLNYFKNIESSLAEAVKSPGTVPSGNLPDFVSHFLVSAPSNATNGTSLAPAQMMPFDPEALTLPASEGESQYDMPSYSSLAMNTTA